MFFMIFTGVCVVVAIGFIFFSTTTEEAEKSPVATIAGDDSGQDAA